MWNLILVYISFLLFIVYNSVAIGIFGVPRSMSKTYYLYEDLHKGLGWIFTGFMWIMALTLLPGWISIATALGSWLSYFTFLAFITCAGIAFVGTAPRYYDEFEEPVHMTAAKICAGSALLWCFLVSWNVWYIPMIFGAGIASLIGALTKTWGSARDYWLEMIAFDATFLTIIVEGIIPYIVQIENILANTFNLMLS